MPKKVPTNYIKIIEQLNTYTKIRVKTGESLTEEIPWKYTVIRQGNSLSPILCNIIMAKMIENIQSLNCYKTFQFHLTGK